MNRCGNGTQHLGEVKGQVVVEESVQGSQSNAKMFSESWIK